MNLRSTARCRHHQNQRPFAWIIGHATTLLNLDTVGSDGKVPFERWRGRRHHMGRCVCGERVWYRLGPLTDRSMAEDRMESGILVGFRMKSSEHTLIADVGATTARPVWPRDRRGHQQEAAVRPMRARREGNPDLDEAPLPKPPAVAAPSKSDFDTPGLTPGGAEQCEKAHEPKVTQRCAAPERKNCFKEQRRANTDARRLNAAHWTRLVNGPPSESRSRSPTDQ